MSKQRFSALNTQKSIKAELRSVYREARSEQMDILKAEKLSKILKLLSDLMTAHELEQRVEQLEKELKR